MTEPLPVPSPEALARLRVLVDRRLSREEVEAGLAARLGERELEESRELVRWFLRRYPTPAERLAYARRAYARWSLSFPAPPAKRAI